MSLICTRMSSLCHSYVLLCNGVSLVCTRMSSACHSYVLVYHLCVARMYSHVTCMYSHVMICHSYALTCHTYVTRMHSYVLYVFRMSLVCVLTSSICHSYLLACHPYQRTAKKRRGVVSAFLSNPSKLFF